MNLAQIIALSETDFSTLVNRLTALRDSKITLAIPTREVKRKAPIPANAGKWERKLLAHWEKNNSRLCLRMGSNIKKRFKTREAYAIYLCKGEGLIS